MRLFKTFTQTLYFLFASTLLLAQTTVKEKDFSLKYSTNKIGIQFDDTNTMADIKAFDAFTKLLKQNPYNFKTALLSMCAY